jgi:nucleotide-binding universal stress UspA family protein
MPAVVVVGCDGSPAARQALREGALLARGGRLVVVYAREEAPQHLTSRWRELLEQEHIEQGEALLERIVREADVDLDDVTLQTRLLGDRPAHAIMTVAREVDADMIVVGSHGYAAFSEILGSVSHELVRKATLPVVVIPPACAERMTAEELAARAS